MASMYHCKTRLNQAAGHTIRYGSIRSEKQYLIGYHSSYLSMNLNTVYAHLIQKSLRNYFICIHYSLSSKRKKRPWYLVLTRVCVDYCKLSIVYWSNSQYSTTSTETVKFSVFTDPMTRPNCPSSYVLSVNSAIMCPLAYNLRVVPFIHSPITLVWLTPLRMDDAVRHSCKAE